MKETILYAYRNENLYLHHTRTENPDPEHFSFRNHSHHMHEIYYFLSGGADFAVEGNIYTLKRGALILTTQGQAHNILIQDPASSYERIALLFSPRMLPEGFSAEFSAINGGMNAFFLSEREQIWLEESFRTIESCPHEDQAAASIQALITVLLGKIAALIETQPEFPSVQQDLVRDIIQFIHQHLTDEWHLADLEKALYRNKIYLNRRFKSVMGCGIWEYTLRKRIFAAQQQLYLSRNILDTYQASGFQDYSVFYRQYKKYTGLSPSEDLKILLPDGEKS